jgi:hypothetical protein
MYHSLANGLSSEKFQDYPVYKKYRTCKNIFDWFLDANPSFAVKIDPPKRKRIVCRENVENNVGYNGYDYKIY